MPVEDEDVWGDGEEWDGELDEERYDAIFNRHIDNGESYTTMAVVAAMFIGTYAIYELPGVGRLFKEKLIVRQTLRSEIRTGKAPEQFSFKGYFEGRAADYMIGSVKGDLAEVYGAASVVSYETATPSMLGELVSSFVPLGDLADKFVVEDELAFRLFFPENMLSEYANVMEGLKQLGRVEDPRSVENLAFRNSERISDMIGNFGSNQADIRGQLGIYQDMGVMIPWDDAGSNTCDDCTQLRDEGPYWPDEYPEPPHYGCECGPGDPVVVGWT